MTLSQVPGMRPQAAGRSGAVQQWVAVLRRLEDGYAHAAAQRGEPFTPLTDAEHLAAATLAVALGIQPCDALHRPLSTQHQHG